MRFCHQFLILLAAPLAAQNVPFDAAAALARFRWIETGAYQRQQHAVHEPDQDDVALCLSALASADDAARSHACLALEALARESFFKDLPDATRASLLPPLFAALRSPHTDTAEWGTRALGSLVGDPRLVSDKDARQLLVQGLALVVDDDVETRRRAGLLLERLLPRCSPADHVQVARMLQVALDRHPRQDREGERTAMARTVLCGVLTRLDVADAGLAGDLAARCLADLAAPAAFGFHYDRADALLGLGRWFAQLRGERREHAFAALLAAVGDARLQYMTTSGRRTPFHHHGHEALAAAAPAMDAGECERAAAALAAARERAIAAMSEAQDVASMFDGAQQAVAARQRALAK
jgi:hypothetical protein